MKNSEIKTIFLFEYKNEQYEKLIKDILKDINFFKDIPINSVSIQYLFENKENTKLEVPDDFYNHMKNKLQNATCYILFGKSTYSMVHKLIKNRVIKNVNFLTDYKKCTFSDDNVLYISTLAPGYLYRGLLEDPEWAMLDEYKLHLTEIREYIKVLLR